MLYYTNSPWCLRQKALWGSQGWGVRCGLGLGGSVALLGPTDPGPPPPSIGEGPPVAVMRPGMDGITRQY